MNRTFIFLETCKRGDLRGAQQEYQLIQQEYQLNPNMNITAYITAYNNTAFKYACEYGHLHVAQWLLLICPTIHVSEENTFIFCRVCDNGDLRMAQWLLQVCPTIDISAYKDLAFRWACRNGHLEVAQWLLQISKEINISAENNDAFRGSCIYKHLHVAQWLLQMKPYLYVIEYDKKGEMKSYRIREKEEANWERRKYLVWLASNHCPDENKHNLLYKLPSDVSRMIIGFV
jgi:hypothetical protein